MQMSRGASSDACGLLHPGELKSQTRQRDPAPLIAVPRIFDPLGPAPAPLGVSREERKKSNITELN